MRSVGIIGAVDNALGNQHYVSCTDGIKAIVNKIIALAFLHLVELKGSVIMLGRNTALGVFPLIKVEFSIIFRYHFSHEGTSLSFF